MDQPGRYLKTAVPQELNKNVQLVFLDILITHTDYGFKAFVYRKRATHWTIVEL